MTVYQFVLAMVLAFYVGFSRFFQSVSPTGTDADRDAEGVRLPPQSTFWRFLASLHLAVARQLLEVQRRCASECGKRRTCG